MGLLRFQVFAVYAVTFFSIWYMVILKKAEWELSPGALILVDFAPIWAVVLVGLYLLSVLIIGVMQFEDCPQAAKELDSDVKAAKEEMKKRGII